jgi:hypothetical protein
MTAFQIRDLSVDLELDRAAMKEIRGGALEGLLGSIDILSPDLYNKVTPITGLADISTGQTNNLAQIDHTVATNGLGINFVSNNKFADQINGNTIVDILKPFVG